MIEKYIEKLSKYKNFKVRVFSLDVNPRCIDIGMSIQEELNESVGIKREGNRDYTILHEDGPRVYGAEKIRQGTITYKEHLKRFRYRNKRRAVVAFIGNGNLLFNPWFVAWANGKVYRLKDEPFQTRIYSSLIVWKRRRKFPATVGDVKYIGNRVLLTDRQNEEEITDKIKFTTFGQRLVKNHKPVEVHGLVNQVYDLRHFLPALYYKTDDGQEYNFGLDQLHKDEKKKMLAVKKEPVILKMSIKNDVDEVKVDANKLRRVLLEADFQEVNSRSEIKNEGQYYISPNGNTITIKYKPNIYPHCIIGTTDEGTVRCIVVTGLSGRAGISIENASKLAADLDMKDAILLCNGGDVVMKYLDEMVVKSSEERRRLRSLLIFTKGKPNTTQKVLLENEMRLLEYA